MHQGSPLFYGKDQCFLYLSQTSLVSHCIFCRGWIKCFNCLRISYINAIYFNQTHLLSSPFHFSPHPPPPYHPPQHHVLFFLKSQSPFCAVSMYTSIGPSIGTWAAYQRQEFEKQTNEQKKPQFLTVPSNSHQLSIIALQLGVGLCDPFLIHAAVSLYVQWPRHVQRTSL